MSKKVFYTTLANFLQEKPGNLEEIKNQYLYLLSFLTAVEDMDENYFYRQVMNISITGEIVVGYVIDSETRKEVLVASGTILYEPKIIHGARNVGHIEDVVVLPDFRGQGIADTVIGILSEMAKDKDCYKMILDCKEELMPVYRKSGFEKWGYQMAHYFM